MSVNRFIGFFSGLLVALTVVTSASAATGELGRLDYFTAPGRLLVTPSLAIPFKAEAQLWDNLANEKGAKVKTSLISGNLELRYGLAPDFNLSADVSYQFKNRSATTTPAMPADVTETTDSRGFSDPRLQGFFRYWNQSGFSGDAIVGFKPSILDPLTATSTVTGRNTTLSGAHDVELSTALVMAAGPACEFGLTPRLTYSTEGKQLLEAKNIVNGSSVKSESKVEAELTADVEVDYRHRFTPSIYGQLGADISLPNTSVTKDAVVSTTTAAGTTTLPTSTDTVETSTPLIIAPNLTAGYLMSKDSSIEASVNYTKFGSEIVTKNQAGIATDKTGLTTTAWLVGVSYRYQF